MLESYQIGQMGKILGQILCPSDAPLPYAQDPSQVWHAVKKNPLHFSDHAFPDRRTNPAFWQ